MERQMRFHYEGTWTRWFSDGEDLTGLRAFQIDTVEISETLTRNEFVMLFPNHPSIQPQQ